MEEGISDQSDMLLLILSFLWLQSIPNNSSHINQPTNPLINNIKNFRTHAKLAAKHPPALLPPKQTLPLLTPLPPAPALAQAYTA